MSEVWLSAQMLRLLDAMLGGEDWHGLQLCQATELGAGTAYPLLVQLLRAKWVERSWERLETGDGDRPARTLYRLTPEGRQLAGEAIASRSAAAVRELPQWGFPGAEPA